MAKRPSLKGNVTTGAEKAAQAADVARKLAGTPQQPAAASPDVEYETVSYNLPLDLIDLCRDLADLRHAKDQAEKRALRREIKAAKRAGLAGPVEAPTQARRSASAVVREAIEKHRKQIEAEIDQLKG